MYFKLRNTTDNVLLDILGCINIENYCWYNIESETQVWDKTYKNDLLTSNYYNGEILLKFISSKHFAMFIKFQAYFKDGTFTDISTYDDFKNSDCQVMFLLHDCDFVEVYAKEKEIIDKFYKRALKLNCEEIEYKTDKNDIRTRMSF